MRDRAGVVGPIRPHAATPPRPSWEQQAQARARALSLQSCAPQQQQQHVRQQQEQQELEEQHATRAWDPWVYCQIQ